MELTRLTAKCTATVPSDVRRALKLRAGDAIEWKVADSEERVRKARDDDGS